MTSGPIIWPPTHTNIGVLKSDRLRTYGHIRLYKSDFLTYTSTWDFMFYQHEVLVARWMTFTRDKSVHLLDYSWGNFIGLVRTCCGFTWFDKSQIEVFDVSCLISINFLFGYFSLIHRFFQDYGTLGLFGFWSRAKETKPKDTIFPSGLTVVPWDL